MIYFLSDAHLGSLLEKDPRAHEQMFVSWLDTVKKDAKIIYLLGDIFDFWYEYKTVVPKGYVRTLGKIAELTDSGIEVHFLIGNHDLWVFDYFQKELGMKVHYEPFIVEHNDKRFFLAHGDEFMTSNRKFRILRKVFHSKVAQTMFGWVPPRLGQSFGYKWSAKNRLKLEGLMNTYQGEDKEEIVKFAKSYESNLPIDYFVFGHRHIELNLQLKNKARVMILGDFIDLFSYAKFDGKELSLETFSTE